jgi:hypothetical protein
VRAMDHHDMTNGVCILFAFAFTFTFASQVTSIFVSGIVLCRSIDRNRGVSTTVGSRRPNCVCDNLKRGRISNIIEDAEISESLTPLPLDTIRDY